MPLDFEKHAAKGNEFVRLVADELVVSRDKAGRIIRAVFHALRNRLTHEESFHLLAQLPVAIKGIYVDGWKFKKDYSRIIHVNDFLNEVRTEDGVLAAYDLGNNQRAEKAVAAVFKAMNYFVSEGEFKDVLAVLPEEIRHFIQESLAGEGTVL
ncbi:MAG: DUF2267 domain-containing protein [Chitinophagaceae bacterium]|nr:DUF2267 domain-containing protein [Chitinophagaceae bacterium]